MGRGALSCCSVRWKHAELRSRKTNEEIALSMVSHNVRESAMCSLLARKVPAEVSLEDMEDEEAPAPAGDASEDHGSPDPVPLVAAESPELHSREWLNLYGIRDGKAAQVVDFFPGSGTLALAACRQGHNYVGFACSQTQKSICRQHILLAIVLELILNKRDGFTSGRFLSKERSLGGGSDADLLAMTPSRASAVTSPQKPDEIKAAGGDKPGTPEPDVTPKGQKARSSSSSSSS